MTSLEAAWWFAPGLLINIYSTFIRSSETRSFYASAAIRYDSSSKQPHVIPNFSMPTWSLKHFHDLTPRELYAILALRMDIFIIEQACLYQDIDGKDLPCLHLMAWNDDQTLAASARIVPPGVTFDEPSIGRVTVARRDRGTGLGRELMLRAIKECVRLYPHLAIQIGAQLYLRDFYSSLGFRPVGEIYNEDGIPHLHMIRPAS